MMLASFLTEDVWIFKVWQFIPMAMLVALIFFWKMYRNKQL